MLYPVENKVREVKNLSGIWNFKMDYDNVGIQEQWQKMPLKDTIPMAVPSSYNDLFTEEREKEHVGYVWYEKSFVIPDSWNGKRIVLRFGSATHHATVWVDGTEVVKHKGGFLPFEADITEMVEKSSLDEHRVTGHAFHVEKLSIKKDRDIRKVFIIRKLTLISIITQDYTDR